MAGIQIQLGDTQSIRQVLNQLLKQTEQLRPAFEDIGEHLQLSHRQHFDQQQSPQGEAWQALSPSTQALKPKLQDQILRLNDILRDHLSYQANDEQLLFGSNQVYAAMMQFGGTTSPNSMIPNVEIPARPFLGINQDDEQAIFEILNQHLSAAL
ncbi:phage virion morphogenesis protein [Agarivorans sp. QJM3NY_25]|uniref:phage virion morphogenesis protein n=1 Tax=Agarivorans sp. QJM3NY_25 TaxID=3421430 RepID=UPI003D7DA681